MCNCCVGEIQIAVGSDEFLLFSSYTVDSLLTEPECIAQVVITPIGRKVI